MHTLPQKLYTFACRFIQIISLLLVAGLFAGGFLSTCYSLDMNTQIVLTRWDNPLYNLLGMSIFLTALFLIIRVSAKSKLKLLTGLVLAWCVLIGALLILFGRTVPAADALSVYSIAEALAEGDTGVIHPTDSYLSFYPQQVGLTAFFELLIRICKLMPVDLPAYHLIKCLYVLFACAIILFQEKTLLLLGKSEAAARVYLLLAGVNFPFLMYTSFVYGEIPSFSAFTFGLYFLAKLWKGKTRHKILSAMTALIFISLSVMLRKNNLILVIAVLLVLIFEWMKSKRHFLLVWGICCGICCFSILPLTQKCYELRAGNTLSTGVTALSYFAMGMQEASRGNGWYNGFNFNTYRDTGMDTAAANEISRAAIRGRLTYFRENPGYAARFYLFKHLSQWADGTYASRQATLATYGNRAPAMVSLYEGKGSRGFIEYCNIYQNILYLGGLFFAVTAFRKKTDILPLYLGLIGVIGGFLFHTIWEANSRYIFLYGLLLLPYAAAGLVMAYNFFFTRKSGHGTITGQS